MDWKIPKWGFYIEGQNKSTSFIHSAERQTPLKKKNPIFHKEETEAKQTLPIPQTRPKETEATETHQVSKAKGNTNIWRTAAIVHLSEALLRTTTDPKSPPSRRRND